MKLFFLVIIYLLLFTNSCISQNLIAYVKDTIIKTYDSLEEFKENSTLQLTDTSLKIKSYVAYFACDYNFHKVGEEPCYVSVTTVLGNTLQGKNFIELLNKYKKHFYIVFDNVLYLDRDGETKGAIGPRIDIK